MRVKGQEEELCSPQLCHLVHEAHQPACGEEDTETQNPSLHGSCFTTALHAFKVYSQNHYQVMAII